MLLTQRIGEGEGFGAQRYRVYCSILDMARSNPRFDPAVVPGRMGALVDLVGDPLINDFTLPQFDEFLGNGQVGLLALGAGVTYYVGGLMDAIDTGHGADKWLFFTDGIAVTRYKLSSTGLAQVGVSTVPTTDPEENYEHSRWAFGEMDAVHTTSELRVAFTTHGYVFDEVALPIHRQYVVLQRYTTAGVLICSDRVMVQEYAVGPNDPVWSRINGLEFEPNGRYIYYLKTPNAVLGYVDANTLNASDLALDLTAYKFSHLETGPAPGEPNEKAIYALAPSGYLGALLDTGSPGTVSWQPQAAVLPSVTANQGIEDADYLLPGNFSGEFFTLQSQSQGYAPYATNNAEICCDQMVAAEGFTYRAPAGVVLWTPGTNPFNNHTSPIYVKQELRIGSGAQVTASNMVFRFGPGAKLTIEPGGYFYSTGCTFTSACEDRWAGIRVNGNTSLDQTPTIGGDQGYLRLSNSTVSNAVIGVRCATETNNGGLISTGYGGIIIANNSTFKNCITGVDIRNYSGNQPGGIENNLCRFSGCDFITDSDWPDNATPQWMARISKTRKVDFLQCDFMYLPGAGAPSFPGYGLLSASAEVLVNGGAVRGRFNNLVVGVYRVGDPLTPITVNNCKFNFNRDGIMDGFGHFGRYTNNIFYVPDQAAFASPCTGLTLWQSRFFTVERNTFNGMPQRDESIGIFFAGAESDGQGVAYDDEEIYDNVFNTLHTGCLVNGLHRDGLGSAVDNGLKIFCGDYTNNVHDVEVARSSTIRKDQYENSAPPQLAGNRYYGQADCLGESDWILDDDWNADVAPHNGMVINYLRHEDVLCQVFCPDPVDDDFEDQGYDFSGPFLKEIACANGLLDNNHTVLQAHTAYAEAKALNLAAYNLLEGLTDGGERPDLLEELQQDDPWLSSGFLRDRLMLNSPLSNLVLKAVILREQPMDPWHITQVMVENSPLDPGIHNELNAAGILDSFFKNVVTQAQTGQGPSSKQLLQEEWMLRRGQQTRAWAQLGYLWATDTVEPGGEDSLRLQLHAGNGLDHRMARLARHLHLAEVDEAALVASEFARYESGADRFVAVAEMAMLHEGDWSLLDSAEVDSLWLWAEQGHQGAALFSGLLVQGERGMVQREPRFALKTKRMGSAGVELSAGAGERPVLSIFPTPAESEAMLVFPGEWKSMPFVVEDAVGALVTGGRLEAAGMHRLAVAQWPSGVYSVRAGGASVRLVVKH